MTQLHRLLLLGALAFWAVLPVHADPGYESVTWFGLYGPMASADRAEWKKIITERKLTVD